MASEKRLTTSSTNRLEVVFVLVISILLNSTSSLNISQCRAALGMQSGEIPDDSVTASSSFDPLIFGPTKARIRTEGEGGAWCPKEQILKTGSEFLEIDLGQLKVITLVETQGRFGNGQGQEYVEQYRLQFQREDTGHWFTFHNRRGQQIFQGNANTYMTELREVDPPLITRRVRFVPYSTHPKHACMRVELYGCPWKDGVVSYDVPQGERRGVDVDLTDATYDGIVDGQRLSGGLGQLTDGELGSANFRSPDHRGNGVKGYDWVGWSNDSVAIRKSGGRPGTVELTFRFDALRNFSSVRVHSNDMRSRDVGVFRSAHASTSVDGETFIGLEPPLQTEIETESETSESESETESEKARDVVIPLRGAVGRYVRLRLEFSARWMLISEVSFESEYAAVDPTRPLMMSIAPREVATITDRKDSGHASLTSDNGSSHGGLPININNNNNRPYVPGNGDIAVYDDTGINRDRDTGIDTDNEYRSPTHHYRRTANDEYIGAVVGSLATLALLLFTVAGLLAWRRRRKMGVHTVLKCLDTPTSGSSSTGQMQSAVPSVRSSSGQTSTHTACSVNGHAATSGKTVNGARYQFVGTCDVESPDLHPVRPALVTTDVGPSSKVLGADPDSAADDVDAAVRPALTCCGGQGGCRRQPDDVGHNMPQLPATPPDSSSEAYAPNDFAISSEVIPSTAFLPNVSMLPGCTILSPSAHRQPAGIAPVQCGTHGRRPPRSLPVASLRHCSTLGASRATVRRLAPTAAAAATAGETGSLDGLLDDRGRFDGTLNTVDPEEIQRDRLRFLEKIGDGRFGEIYICEVVDDNETYSDERQLAAVKMLRRNADDNSRSEFDQLVSLSCRLCDPYVVRLLGVCKTPLGSHSPLYWAVFEHLPYGDLKNFLRQHRPGLVDCSLPMKLDSKQTSPSLSHGTLIHMASQIASAMKYLETLNVVHGDLAARSCLVGELCEVKVADVGGADGTGRCRYPEDYTAVEFGRAPSLPIRWMSWESALMGEFSTRSDVWAFGVTLWEILTMARQLRPLGDQLPDDAAVLANLDACRRGLQSSVVQPPPPPGCPREIYDLMRECWQRDAALRPSFREVNMFLQRKNIGYSPEARF